MRQPPLPLQGRFDWEPGRESGIMPRQRFPGLVRQAPGRYGKVSDCLR